MPSLEWVLRCSQIRRGVASPALHGSDRDPRAPTPRFRLFLCATLHRFFMVRGCSFVICNKRTDRCEEGEDFATAEVE